MRIIIIFIHFSSCKGNAGKESADFASDEKWALIGTADSRIAALVK